jgi:hypothetical protein
LSRYLTWIKFPVSAFTRTWSTSKQDCDNF